MFREFIISFIKEHRLCLLENVIIPNSDYILEEYEYVFFYTCDYIIWKHFSEVSDNVLGINRHLLNDMYIYATKLNVLDKFEKYVFENSDKVLSQIQILFNLYVKVENKKVIILLKKYSIEISEKHIDNYHKNIVQTLPLYYYSTDYMPISNNTFDITKYINKHNILNGNADNIKNNIDKSIMTVKNDVDEVKSQLYKLKRILINRVLCNIFDNCVIDIVFVYYT